MNHRQAQGQLADFAEGRLPEAVRVEISSHLAECEACGEWLETYDLVGSALAAASANEHLEAEDLASWAVDGTEPPAREKEHLAACAECGREFELLREALREARGGRPGAAATVTDESQTGVVFRWALAASLAFAIFAGWSLLAPTTGTTDDYAISGGTLAGTETIVARSIHASGVEIETGSKIVFEVQETVTFGEGFAVASGATLEVGRKGVPGV